jgi:hypothetical protein
MPQANDMKCWICGEDGKTGEHILKASDLRSQFGHVSQEKPLYFHTSKKRNIPVGSLKSKRFKSRALICNNCNSSLTQPYDRAWEKLSSHLRLNADQFLKAGKINLSRVFPGQVKKSMLHVHLFFVKIFGCHVVGNNVPIDIKEFSHVLLNNKAHKDFYLAFGPSFNPDKKGYTGITPIETVDLDGASVFATWLYMIDNIAVNIIYTQQHNAPDVLKNTWHPSSIQKVLKFKKWN